MTCAIFALFAASLNLLTFCCGVSFFGAGSANCSVVARPPGRVCAHTPVAVKRVESFGDFDMFDGEDSEDRENGSWWWRPSAVRMRVAEREVE